MIIKISCNKKDFYSVIWWNKRGNRNIFKKKKMYLKRLEIVIIKNSVWNKNDMFGIGISWFRIKLQSFQNFPSLHEDNGEQNPK